MEELGPLFTHPGEVSEIIPGALPLALAVAALVLGSWILVRGKVGESLAAAGLVTLPMLAFALSDFVVIERSKKADFCVSCHLMKPLLDTARPEDSTSMASIHIARGAVPSGTACYTCHAGYGIFGEVDAKLAGVRHMYMTVLGTHSNPLEIYGTFDIDSCLGCHSSSKRFQDVEAHRTPQIQSALLARQMSCTGACHVSAHSEQAVRTGDAE